MRKLLMSLAAIALALAIPTSTVGAYSLLDFEAATTALAQFDPELDPPPNDPNKDFVVGGFMAYSFNNGLSVRSGPNGEDPSGMASATDPQTGFKIREKAVCLAVQGNLAAAGFIGVFTFPDGEFDPYTEIDVFRDGGPGGTLDGFDAFLPNPGGGPEDCEDFLLLALTAAPIESGNILINDAP